MGGKSYYCDYCEKHMKNDIKVRKNHIDGLPHTIAKANYMAQYRDPKEILLIESIKTPCSRFHVNGYCKFSQFCHFSHYTVDDLYRLREIVDKTPKIIQKEVTSTVPWNLKKTSTSLPPSLQPIDFSEIEITRNEWGE